MKPKVVVIVQARMGSTRLPRKHFKKVLSRPLISYLFERLHRVKSADLVVLATTVNPKDDELEVFCSTFQKHIPLYRGSEDDVLGRFAEAANVFGADIVVRICGDCPLIDPAVIDEAVSYYLTHPHLDLVSNVIERTYPRGMDVEVFSAQALAIAAEEACSPEEREHVTPFFYRHPEKFSLGSITYSTNESAYRWTVDTSDDLALISRILEDVYPQNPEFSIGDLLSCAKQHPEWGEINVHVRQKSGEQAASARLGLEFARPIEAHARLIFTWRNDPDTRKASFHGQIKCWEDFFYDYMHTYFNLPDLPPLFVIEEGRRVAFLRMESFASLVNHNRKCCEISINVAPECRGRGIGVSSLLLAKEFLRSKGYDDVYAEVKVGNVASTQAFLRAGFSLLQDAEITVFDTGEQFSIHRFLAGLSLKDSYTKQHVYIVAEVGSNWHIGKEVADFDVAKRLIEAAAEAGADAVKFQVFQPDAIYVPNAGQSDYLAEAGIQKDISLLFKELTLPPDILPRLAGWAKAAGIDFMATPFSPEDFYRIDPYVERHKIASYEIGYEKLIKLAAESGKPLMMSTGASEEWEIAWAVDTFQGSRGKHLTLLQCTARYPAEPESVNLRAIPWLRKRFGVDAGLSDHSLDPLAAPLGAVALGATVIEKHLTLDKTYQGPDHAYALTPTEFKQMVDAVRRIEVMLGSGTKYVYDVERELRAFAKRGVQTTREIKLGDPFKEGVNIAVLRPGKQPLGVHPLFLPQIEGKLSKRDIPLGSGVQFGDF